MQNRLVDIHTLQSRPPRCCNSLDSGPFLAELLELAWSINRGVYAKAVFDSGEEKAKSMSLRQIRELRRASRLGNFRVRINRVFGSGQSRVDVELAVDVGQEIKANTMLCNRWDEG